MRRPGESHVWNLLLIPGSAHVLFVDQDYVAMFTEALRRYRTLDPSVPWDQVAFNITGPPAENYARRVLWVPQQQIIDSGKEEVAVADCNSETSKIPRPLCFLIKSDIRFAVDPLLGGGQMGCWYPDSWSGPPLCGPVVCGELRLDWMGVAMHEAGHMFGLDNVTNADFSQATMYQIQVCDTTRRYLMGCEAEAVIRAYHDNPAAAVTDLTVLRTPGAARIDWKWIGGSSTRRFHVAYAPNWTAPPQFVASIPAVSHGLYSTTVPGVQDGVLSLYEEEPDSTMLRLGGDEIGDLPPLAPEHDPVPLNPDSLRAAFLQSVPPSSGLSSAIQNVIFAPDSFLVQARWMAQWKRDMMGINSIAISIDSLGGLTQSVIKTAVAQLQPSAGTVTLLGAATELFSVTGQPMRSDARLWVNGRTKPTFPDQPKRDIIRTYFVVDTVPLEQSLSHAQPWITTDSWFVDFDGDLLPDAGRGIGRLPAANQNEAWALVTFAASRTGSNRYGGVWHLGYSFDNGRSRGALVTSALDSLRNGGWPAFVPHARIESSPSYPLSGKGCDEAMTSALRSSAMFVEGLGTYSTGYGWINFGSKWRNYRYSTIPPAEYAPVVLAWSCFSANCSATQDPQMGRRPADDALLYNLARGWIGSTAGTVQRANIDLALQFKAAWLAHPDRGIGVLLADAQRACMATDRRDSVLFEYNLMGDPDLQVLAPQPVPVAVASRSAHLQLSVWPNPASSLVSVSWSQTRAERVRVEVYDVGGRRIADLVNRDLTPGPQTAIWRPRSASAGVYFVAVRGSTTFERKAFVWGR